MDQNISRSNRMGMPSRSPRFGKAGLDAACARHGPRRLGSTYRLAEQVFSKFRGVDKPKSGGKAVLRHPSGMEHGNPGKDAPHVPTLPRRPGSALLMQSCVVQEMALPGGGLHAPVTPLQALLRPLRHRGSEGKRAGSAPRSRGVYGRRCRWEGGERRCLLNIASSRPRGSVTQLVTLARVLPVVLPGVGGAWRLWGHPSGRIPEGAQGRMELYVAGSYRA